MVRYLFVFLLIGVIFWAIWSIKGSVISKKAKSLITIFLLLLFAFAYMYQSDFDDKSTKNMHILTSFKQGRVIKCDDYNVTKYKFNYEFGTSCFVAKREIAELNGVIIPISKCKNE